MPYDEGASPTHEMDPLQPATEAITAQLVNVEGLGKRTRLSWMPSLLFIPLLFPMLLLGPWAAVFSYFSKGFSKFWAGIMVHRLAMPVLHMMAKKKRIEMFKADCKGRLLDVGCGILPHYALYEQIPAITEVVAMEPNPHCHGALQSKAKRAVAPKITISSRTLEEEPDNSYDTIILSFVMCEIPGYEKIPAQVLRVLKPGGCCLFFEHIGAEKGSLMRRFQNTLQPLWYLLTDGCHCNREQHHCIEGLPWAELRGDKMALPMLARCTMLPHIPRIYAGVAKKAELEAPQCVEVASQ